MRIIYAPNISPVAPWVAFMMKSRLLDFVTEGKDNWLMRDDPKSEA
jgi:hypothetical protein